jgi:type II secretory pathway pseudopilin PulG
LLEVLVAVAVLAVLAAMLPPSIVAARQSADRSEAWLEARLVAEALIAERLQESAIAPGHWAGSIEGRRWTITATPNRRLSTPNLDAKALLDIRLTVEVSPTELLTVDTMRIGPPL